MIPGSVGRVVRELLRALRASKLEFGLMGGFGVVAWGIARSTYDVDLLVDANPTDLDRFLAACKRHSFDVPEFYAKGWRDRVGGMPLVKLQFFTDGRALPVDVFAANRAHTWIFEQGKEE